MKLSELLSGVAKVDLDIEIDGLSLDSRQTKPGDAFIALNGALQHGIGHAMQAVDNGAVAVIYDPHGIDDSQTKTAGCNAIAIPGLSRHLGIIAAKFYRKPSRHLAVIGITGTNGKTTCSQLIAQAIPACGVIGTLGWGEPRHLLPTANTTPDALAIQQMLHHFVQQQKRAVAMEVSSHGLQQGRINGIEFAGAVFTNLTRDHLDYHGSMAEYLRAKLGLFTIPGLQFAVVNLDDANSLQVLQALDSTVERWGFSTQGNRSGDMECLIADNVEHNSTGIVFDVRWGNRIERATTSIVGAFNLENVMTVLCVLLAMDWSFADAIAQLARLQAVPGRMENYGGKDKPTVFVDYAHTPDALEKVLRSARGNGKLWAVFGCGGDRDKGKRPEMGRIAEACADYIVLTDDNPRSEAPEAITNDILTGCHGGKVSIINDRKTAITTVIRQAAKDDCIVIAGKGHENYQEIGGVRLPFSDREIVQQALAEWVQ